MECQGEEGLAWRPQLLRLPPVSHPNPRRKGERGEKQRKPGGSSWKTFFALGRGPSIPRKKPLPWLGGTRTPPQPSGQKLGSWHGGEGGSLDSPAILLLLRAGSRPDTVTLRSAKSEESLSSQASGAGELTEAWPVPGDLGRVGALSWPLR